MLTNDSDPDGDTTEISAVTSPTNGTVQIVNASLGTVTYTPAPSFTGQDTFDYTIIDGNGGSASATVTITVIDPSNSMMHVGDLVGTSSPTGRKKWRATLTITVHDTSEQLLANVTVTGDWSSGGSGSCTTDAGGTCTMSKSRIARATSSVTFDVKGVIHALHNYDAQSNHVTSVDIMNPW